MGLVRIQITQQQMEKYAAITREDILLPGVGYLQLSTSLRVYSFNRKDLARLLVYTQGPTINVLSCALLWISNNGITFFILHRTKGFETTTTKFSIVSTEYVLDTYPFFNVHSIISRKNNKTFYVVRSTHTYKSLKEINPSLIITNDSF